VGTVNVIIQASTANDIPRNMISANFAPDGSGAIFMRFAGITGRKYKIQASPTFLNPVWQDLPMNTLTVNTDPANGNFWTLWNQVNPGKPDVTKYEAGEYDPAASVITANTIGFIEYTDVDAPLFPTRFYRAILTP
jgi:hypothetical protein